MFPVFRSLSLRYLVLRWDRAALVVLSIALGVATLVSTRILNQCLEAAAHDTETPLPIADFYVSNGELGVRRQIADEIRQAQIAGIEAIVPMIFEQVRLPEIGGPDGRIGMLVAADMNSLASLKDEGKRIFTPVVLNPFSALLGTGVFISEFLYKERQAQGLSDDAGVKIRFADREMVFPLAGYLQVKDDGKAASFQRNLIAMDLRAAYTLLSSRYPASAAVVGVSLLAGGESTHGERVLRVDIHVEKGADLEKVRQAVQTVVGNRASVKDEKEQKKSTDDVISGIQISFSLCSAGALVVGLFLVYNAMSVSVAERRHDIGVLRALGAMRTQIARLFASEAALLGLAGAALGIPLGSWLANTALDFVKDDLNSMFLNPDIRPSKLSMGTALWAMAAGITTALLAALSPAVQAANDEPADAVRRAPTGTNRIFRFIHRAGCILLIIGGFGLILGRDSLPSRLNWIAGTGAISAQTISYIGLFSILIGLFLFLPILVGLLARSMQPPLRWFLGIEARLAADNLIRSPARTGVVIGALAAGVSLMIQTAGVGRSNEEPIKKWIEQVIQADAFVFSGSLTSANSSLAPMRPLVREKIEQVEGVERVVGLRFVRPVFRNSMICMVAIDADDYFRGTRARLPAGLPSLETFQKLSQGHNIVVSDNFALKFNMKVGDVVTLPRQRGGPVDLTIVGMGQDYTWSKGTLFIDRKLYVELFEDDFVDVYHVYEKEDADRTATRHRIENAVAPYKLVVEDKAFVKDFLSGIIDKIYRIAYLQQVIIAIVASLGVVTALLISVLQRRRELGLLRAVGATQPQILKTVLAEALLMGIIGTLLGIALGLPMEWYLLRVVLFEESGFWFEMIVPWKEALAIAIVAVGIATLAGLIPAIHAVRLKIVDAIAYE